MCFIIDKGHDNNTMPNNLQIFNALPNDLIFLLHAICK